ncbi:hypothetical protein FBZ86_13822 [Gluconacetobacter diazotrophicus]|nr:hypothetical protein FBZ86_13822 [Gluconacetobacter diazotrophicus]
MRLFDSGEQNTGQRLQIQHVRSGRLDQFAKLHGPLCLERPGSLLKRLQLAVDIPWLAHFLLQPILICGTLYHTDQSRVTRRAIQSNQAP